MFFTDSLDTCLKRASERHVAGLHLVEPNIVKEMYEQTLALLAQNFKLIDSLTLVNAPESDVPEKCGEWKKHNQKLELIAPKPPWINELQVSLKPHLREKTQQQRKPRRGPRL